MLPFVDTFSGWVEAYTTQKETVPIVIMKLVQEIIPRFGLPLALGYNNGLAVVVKESQNLTKVLNIN